MTTHRLLAVATVLLSAITLLTGVTTTLATTSLAPATATQHTSLDDLRQQVAVNGRIRIIVGLNSGTYLAEGLLNSPDQITTQRANIQLAQQQLLRDLSQTDTTVNARFQFIPYLALTVDAAALEILAAQPLVATIQPDTPEPLSLASSIPTIGADAAWASGYTGAGVAVAVLDTGVDKTHPFFSTGGQKIVSEACFSTNNISDGASSLCPGGATSSIAPNSGLNCSLTIYGCDHGTHVAGIVAGNDATGPNFGVAKDANLIAIQVFSRIADCSDFRVPSPCAMTYPTDQILAMERVYELASTYNIAAVNLSLGANKFTTTCDNDARKAIIDTLRSVDIATVAASGNNGFTDGITSPACISTAVSVGATYDNDILPTFTNVSTLLDLLAPGVFIDSANVGGGTVSKSGTSMAAPHVSGAWAVFREAYPQATVDEILASLRITGVPVDDTRLNGTVTDIPRIQLDDALAYFNARLSLLNFVNPTNAWPGETLTYSLRVYNPSASTITDIILTDTVPFSMTLQPTSLSGDAVYDGVTSGSTITWTVGTLLPEEVVTRTFTAVIQDSTMVAGPITNTAYVTASNVLLTTPATAVVDVNGVSTCGFSDGFESGSLSPYWTTFIDNQGRIYASSITPHSGTYALYLDDASNQTPGDLYSHAAVILTLNLDGVQNANLSFWWREFYDENHADDGVFMSNDGGAIWHQIYSFNDGPQVYTQTVIDLVQSAANNGITLNNRTQVKFQFYDNSPLDYRNPSNGDGYALDDIHVLCGEVVYLPILLKP